MSSDEEFDTIVVGGGQAGLAAGYFLAQKRIRFTILDENQRSGETWRLRWDSLRLFTPCKFDGLPGMPLAKPDFYFPSKDEVADYLERYANHFHLPLRSGLHVDKLTYNSNGFHIVTKKGNFLTQNVIIATGPYQNPHIPAFCKDLNPAIQQIHSSLYRNPAQISSQNILIVGAGNSGAEIGLELARAGKHVWLAGREVGHIPADKIGKLFGGNLYWWFVSKILNVKTPIGRKMQPKILTHGTPLIGTNHTILKMAKIEFTPRVAGTKEGKPMLEDGRILPADVIIWATGYHPAYQWINLPIFDELGYPRHERGVVKDVPGLFFVGLPFQTALSSAFLGGVGVDAEYIVNQIGLIEKEETKVKSLK
jgi:putative flavoprotein involved in K+ transport